MKREILVLLFVVVTVFGFTAPCMAAVPPPNTPELQMFSTTTGIDAVGIVTENDALGWRLSSEVLDTNVNYEEYFDFVGEGAGDYIFNTEDEFEYVGPGHGDYILIQDAIYTHEPPLSTGEVQMTIAYDETTNAVNGIVTYNKNSAIHTGAQTLNSYNVKNSKIVTFSALNGGKMVSGENMLLDNVGKSTNIRDSDTGEILPSTVCPFAPAAIGNCAPAFCNIAQTGSKVDVYVASLVTNAQSRSVGQDSGVDMWPPLPIVDGPPVEMDYSIRLTGVGAGNAADGSAMAYFKAHKIEGSRECPSGFRGFGQEITYDEISSASGSITQFQKIINYQSGYKLTG
jgi:hypothetical protein